MSRHFPETVTRKGVRYDVRRIRPTKFLGWAVMSAKPPYDRQFSPLFKTRAQAEPFVVPGTEVRRRFKSKVRKAYDFSCVQYG